MQTSLLEPVGSRVKTGSGAPEDIQLSLPVMNIRTLNKMSLSDGLISPLPTDRKALRRELRAKRRSLSPLQQRHAADAAARQLFRSPLWLRCRSLALYIANDGELSPDRLQRQARLQGRRVFLPILSPRRRSTLLFGHIDKRTRYRDNRFGIPEPVTRCHAPLWTLSLVLLPLVGFDTQGNRLGMGGGFYDRSLASLARHPRRPLLIGMAHECQRVPALPTENWDWPMDGILTDRGLILPCRKGGRLLN